MTTSNKIMISISSNITFLPPIHCFLVKLFFIGDILCVIFLLFFSVTLSHIPILKKMRWNEIIVHIWGSVYYFSTIYNVQQNSTAFSVSSPNLLQIHPWLDRVWWSLPCWLHILFCNDCSDSLYFKSVGCFVLLW